MTGEYTRAELARLDQRLLSVREGLSDLASNLRDLATQVRERERDELEVHIERARELERLKTIVDELSRKVHKAANAVQAVNERFDQQSTAPRTIVPANSDHVGAKAGEVRARTGLWMALTGLVSAVAGYLASLFGR